MAHSYWIVIVFIPAVIITLLIEGYEKFILGIKVKKLHQQFKNASTSEIVYSVFVALVLIAVIIGGLWLLDTFEPADKMVCYGFFLVMSLPWTGASLAYHLDRMSEKGVLFCSFIFSLMLVPTLAFGMIFYFNGYTDSSSPFEVSVIVVNKRIQITKGGGVPLLEFESEDKKMAEMLHGKREKKVAKELYDRVVYGNKMTLYIKPGALGIPWIQGIAEGRKDNHNKSWQY